MSRSFPNNNTNYLSASATAAFQPAGAFTVCAWVKLTVLQAATIIARWNSTTDRSWLLDFNAANGILQWNILGANSVGYGCNKSGVSAGVWAHCAGTFSGALGSVTAWVNGVAGTPTAVASTTIKTSSVQPRVGRRQDSPGPMNGQVAEIATWSVALSTVEMGALAAGCSPVMVRPASLGFYAPLWGAAYPEPDLTGLIDNMTQTGTVAAANHAPVAFPFPVGV